MENFTRDEFINKKPYKRTDEYIITLQNDDEQCPKERPVKFFYKDQYGTHSKRCRHLPRFENLNSKNLFKQQFPDKNSAINYKRPKGCLKAIYDEYSKIYNCPYAESELFTSGNEKCCRLPRNYLDFFNDDDLKLFKNTAYGRRDIYDFNSNHLFQFFQFLADEILKVDRSNNNDVTKITKIHFFYKFIPFVLKRKEIKTYILPSQIKNLLNSWGDFMYQFPSKTRNPTKEVLKIIKNFSKEEVEKEFKDLLNRSDPKKELTLISMEDNKIFISNWLINFLPIFQEL